MSRPQPTPTGNQCAWCTAALPDARQLCQRCTDYLAELLGDIGAYAHELEVTFARQSRGSGRVGARSSDKPLPFHVKAGEALADIQAVLVGWARVVAEEADVPLDCADAPASIAAWLLRRTDWIARHPAATEVIRELETAIDDAKRLIDRPADLVYAGRCSDECEQILYAKPDARHVVCRTCKTRHDVDARRETMLAALDGMLVSAAEAAGLLTYFELRASRTRTRELIAVWAKRGRIVAHGVSLDGHSTYLFGDVVTLAVRHETRQSKGA